MTPVAILFV
jgi:hypothetical protein